MNGDGSSGPVEKQLFAGTVLLAQDDILLLLPDAVEFAELGVGGRATTQNGDYKFIARAPPKAQSGGARFIEISYCIVQNLIICSRLRGGTSQYWKSCCRQALIPAFA